jgi:serine/threonine protein phosphatase PrpC
MNISGKVEVVNISDTGRKRPHNEDSAVTDTTLGLAVVADGMGGYKAGEVASAIAVTAITEEVRKGLSGKKHGQKDDETGLSLESLLLKNAIINANSYIYTTARDEPQCQGMGTTVVSLLFHDDKVSVAHVGDSRVYRVREGSLQQVTNDHSLVQELIDRGFFTPEEAAANTPKNLVTRALGIDANVEVDVAEEAVQTGDIYLLCSDGLNDMISNEDIHLTLSKYISNLVDGANELIRLANENGGKDNISVVLACARQAFPARSGWLSKLLGRFS